MLVILLVTTGMGSGTCSTATAFLMVLEDRDSMRWLLLDLRLWSSHWRSKRLVARRLASEIWRLSDKRGIEMQMHNTNIDLEHTTKVSALVFIEKRYPMV